METDLRDFVVVDKLSDLWEDSVREMCFSSLDVKEELVRLLSKHAHVVATHFDVRAKNC